MSCENFKSMERLHVIFAIIGNYSSFKFYEHIFHVQLMLSTCICENVTFVYDVFFFATIAFLEMYNACAYLWISMFFPFNELVIWYWKYVKFKNKIELYEPLYILLVWVTLFVFTVHNAISNIIEVEVGKRVLLV